MENYFAFLLFPLVKSEYCDFSFKDILRIGLWQNHEIPHVDHVLAIFVYIF